MLKDRRRAGFGDGSFQLAGVGEGHFRVPWEYDMEEVCLILEGKATITPDGGIPLTIGPGDLVTFPRGMKCRWEITDPIRKHYDFR